MCLRQTRLGSNRTVAPRSQRHPTPHTKDSLELLHPTRTFQTHHISGSVVDSPIDLDSSEDALAFDVEFSQGFVVPTVGSTICPDSSNNTLDVAVATLDNTQNVAVATPPSPVVCPDISDDCRHVSEPREPLDVVGIWHVFGSTGCSDKVVGLWLPSGDDVATTRKTQRWGTRASMSGCLINTTHKGRHPAALR